MFAGDPEQLRRRYTKGITQRTNDHFEGIRALKEKRQPRFKGI